MKKERHYLTVFNFTPTEINSKYKKGDRKRFFGIWFRYTGKFWVNEYIPKADGLRKKDN